MRPKLKLVPATCILLTLPITSYARDLTSDILSNEKKVWELFVGAQVDTEAFGRLVTEDYLCIEANGVLMNKTQNIAQLHALTFSSFKIHDAQVRKISSEAALIVARVEFEGTAGGQKMSGEALTSTVWVKRGGQWLVQLHTETFKR
jgi:ketosteroid isomerase-like protein